MLEADVSVSEGSFLRFAYFLTLTPTLAHAQLPAKLQALV